MLVSSAGKDACCKNSIYDIYQFTRAVAQTVQLKLSSLHFFIFVFIMRFPHYNLEKDTNLKLLDICNTNFTVRCSAS